MQGKFEQAQLKYAEDIVAAKEQAAEMAAEMAEMKEDMATVVQALRDAVPEHNDLTTLPLLDVPVPCSGSDDCQFPDGYFDFDDNLFDADVELPDYDAMGEKMAARVDAYEASLARARAEANLDTSHLRESINEVGDELFDDYDPPSVRTEEERSKHNDATEEFKQDSAVSLEQFDRIGEKNESKGYTPSFGGNFSLPDVKGFDLNWFTYQGFNDFGFDFDALFDALAWVAELAINFDMIYRALRTISYLTRIWGRSALMVPPIDVQSDLVSGSMAKRVVSPIQVTRRHCHHCHVTPPSRLRLPPIRRRDADDVPDVIAVYWVAVLSVVGFLAAGAPSRCSGCTATGVRSRRLWPTIWSTAASRWRRAAARRWRGTRTRSRSTTPRRRATATGSTGSSGWRPSAPTRAAATTSGARARSATSSKRCRPPSRSTSARSSTSS